MDSAFYYYDNGRPKLVYFYPNELKLNGSTRVLDTLICLWSDSLGNISLRDGNGYAELQDNNTDIERGQFLNYKRVGEWKGKFMNGKYTFVDQYVDGKFSGGIAKDTLGNTISYDGDQPMIPASYPGGINAFRRLISENYRYPSKAMRNNIKGTVIVSFVVEKDGSLSSFKIVNDLGYGTGDEAVAAVKRVKSNWNPGLLRGVPVRLLYSLPIRLAFR